MAAASMNGNRRFTAERQRNAGAAASNGADSSTFSSEAAGKMMGAIESLRAEVTRDLALLRDNLVPKEDGIEEEQKESAEDAATRERDRAYEELDLLKNEIRSMTYAIQHTKEEIASLYKSSGDESRITNVQHELGTVVQATEEATGKILEAVEKVDELANVIRGANESDYIQGLTDDISEQVTKVFEASNFQDLTGQKLGKIVNTLLFVEERLNIVIEIWGADDIAQLPGGVTDKGLDGLDRTIEQHAETRETIDQTDIDAMFD